MEDVKCTKIQVIFTRYGVLRERKEALIELDTTTYKLIYKE